MGVISGRLDRFMGSVYTNSIGPQSFSKTLSMIGAWEFGCQAAQLNVGWEFRLV